MFTFSNIIDRLLKGHGHRYIKRIPYMTPKGRRYRYIYKVTQSHKGKHAMDESHLVEGTKFMVHTESGKEVHGHIKSVDGDKVTYVLDDGENKGKEITATRSEIVAMMNEKHDVSEKVGAKQAEIKAKIEQAKKTGTEKQVARLEEQLKRLGGESVKEKPVKKESAKEYARLERYAERVFDTTQTMGSKARIKDDVRSELINIWDSVDIAKLANVFKDKYPEVYKEYGLEEQFRTEFRRRARIQREKQNTQMDLSKLRDPIEVTKKVNLRDMSQSDLKPFDQIITSRAVKNSLRHENPYYSKVYSDGNGNVIVHDNHRVVRARENTASPKSVLITKSEARRLNTERAKLRKRVGLDDSALEFYSNGFYSKRYDYKANQIIDLSFVKHEEKERKHKLEELSLYNSSVNEHKTAEQAMRMLDTALATNKPVYTFNDKQERKQIKDKLEPYKADVNAQIKRGNTPSIRFDKVGTKIELTLRYGGDGREKLIHELENVDTDFKSFAIGYEYFSDLLDIGDVTLSASPSGKSPLSYKTALHEGLMMPALIG